MRRYENLRITFYIDEDDCGDLDERNSTSGFVFLLLDGVISWLSKKQSCTALYTMKSKFASFASATQKFVWLNNLQDQLLSRRSPTKETLVYSDNQVAISVTKDPKYCNKLKHINIKYNYVRDIVRHNVMCLEYLSTKEMVVDPFIKPLKTKSFMRHVRSLRLCRLS